MPLLPSGAELPSLDYIDATNIDEKDKPNKIIPGEFIQGYGSESPPETAEILKKLSGDLELFISRGTEDKFEVARLNNTAERAIDLRKQVKAISELTDATGSFNTIDTVWMISTT